LILILGGVMCLICSLVGGVLGYVGYQRLSQSPKLMEGAGQPRVVSQLDDGWVRVHVPELGMELELPSEPESYPLEDWVAYDGLAVAEWTSYSFEKDGIQGAIYGYRYHREMEPSLAELMNDSAAAEEGYDDLKQSKKAIDVKGVAGQQYTATYRYESDPASVHEVFLRRDGKTIMVMLSGWSEGSGAVEPVAQRILESIRWTD
jgi:hypothetical protein